MKILITFILLIGSLFSIAQKNDTTYLDVTVKIQVIDTGKDIYIGNDTIGLYGKYDLLTLKQDSVQKFSAEWQVIDANKKELIEWYRRVKQKK